MENSVNFQGNMYMLFLALSLLKQIFILCTSKSFSFNKWQFQKICYILLLLFTFFLQWILLSYSDLHVNIFQCTLSSSCLHTKSIYHFKSVHTSHSMHSRATLLFWLSYWIIDYLYAGYYFFGIH